MLSESSGETAECSATSKLALEAAIGEVAERAYPTSKLAALRFQRRKGNVRRAQQQLKWKDEIQGFDQWHAWWRPLHHRWQYGDERPAALLFAHLKCLLLCQHLGPAHLSPAT